VITGSIASVSLLTRRPKRPLLQSPGSDENGKINLSSLKSNHNRNTTSVARVIYYRHNSSTVFAITSINTS
jgi:hypothetical protein